MELKKSEYNYKVGFIIPFTPYFKNTFNVKYEGLETHWYENGQKKAETTYKSGELNGLATDWYENGQKEWEINYKDGEFDGLVTRWYENGHKEEEAIYKLGKEILRNYLSSLKN